MTLKDIALLSPTKRALFEVLLKEKGLQVSRIEKILRQGENQTFPLSFAQTRVWFLEQLEPGNPVYNETTTINLKGRLNVEILEQSLNKMVNRHEILRTVFTNENSEPVQKILPPRSVNLSLIDLTEFDSSQQEQEFKKISSKTVLQPFNLKTGPLMRASLFKLHETEHILLLVLHHIATDGWSSQILIQETMAFYEAYSTGNPSVLKELPVQYADFAIWQRNWLQGDVLDKQLTYWKQQLGGKLPVLELPHDYPRPATQTFHAGRESILLSPSFAEELHKLSQTCGSTLFMTLLSAFNILLYRLTGLEDIIVGSPIAGRNRAELEGLIGFFINTLALRTNVLGNLTFQELLAQVRKVSLNAYNYQDMPFEKLVEVLQPERDLSRTAIFQVFFNLLNFDQTNIELSDLTVKVLPRPEQEAKFDLTLYAREKPEGLQLEFVYKSDLFKPERIQEMLGQLQLLLEQIVENPERPITAYSLLTPHALLPDPTLELPQPAYELVPTTLQSWITKTPTAPAIRQFGESWSYAQLGESIQTIIQSLQERGLQKGQTVAVTGHRSFGLMAGIVSVLCSGGVLLTLASNLPKERYQLMLEQAQVKYLLMAGTPPAHLELDETLQVIHLDPQTGQVQERSNEKNQAEWPVIDPDDPAYLFFTSGTTGIPKGVLGCHKGLAHFLTWQRQTFQVGPNDRNAQLTGLSFDVVLRDIFLPLTSGATLCLPDEDDLTPGRILPWMDREQITLLHTVPSLAASWLMSVPKGVKLASLRQIFCAGEPLTNTLVQQWRDAFPNAGEIVNIYGPTETTLAKCFYRVPTNLAPGVQPVGTTLPETQALVLGENYQRCGIGEPGEIVIRTPFRSLGYINTQSENQSRFVPNPYRQDEQDLLYHTGDRGRYRPDGLLEILGRIDHQVKIRGVRIEPGEIQAILAQHPDVQQTVVVAREDHPGDKRLVAYIVLHSQNSEKSPSSIAAGAPFRSFLKQKLPEYMVPSAFVILDKIPLTPNGKVDRRALPAPDYDPSDQTANFVAPRNDVESRLAEIWQDVLGITKISVTDNFFEIGGHSLLAVQLFAKIGSAFNQELPLATLFHAPTIEQLAILLDSDPSKLVEIAGSALVPLKTGTKRPFFCVHTIGGHLLRYNDLARYLDEDQPVYGLQSVGLDGRQKPYFSVEEMAAHYIQEIRMVQPAGPYLLGGASFGGKVAYEMARQLRASGEEVAVLAMFDTYAGKLSSSSDSLQQKGSRHLKQLLQLSPPEQVKYIWRWVSVRLIDKTQKLKWQGMKVACQMYERLGQPLPPALREFRVLQANLHARKMYKSHPYAGSIILFRATEAKEVLANHPLLGWDRLVTGPIHTYDCPGHHISMIFEPHIATLAKYLQACLDEVGNG